MQTSLVVLFLGVICVVGYGNASIVGGILEPGVVISRYYSMMSRTDAETDACTAVGVKCSADCKKLILCMASSGAGTETECATTNAATPVCDKNKNQCAASLSTAGCEPPKDSYVCMMDGVFPDPRDCKKYYMCTGGAVTVVACTGTATFNAGAGACVSTKMLRTTAATTACPAPLTCGTTNPSYAVYKPFPAYYMLCIGTESYMMKCEDDVNQYFDATSKQCVYSCKAAGSFPDANKGFFWYCSKSGAIGVKNACPDKYEFNAASSKCLPPAAAPAGGAEAGGK